MEVENLMGQSVNACLLAMACVSLVAALNSGCEGGDATSAGSVSTSNGTSSNTDRWKSSSSSSGALYAVMGIGYESQGAHLSPDLRDLCEQNAY